MGLSNTTEVLPFNPHEIVFLLLIVDDYHTPPVRHFSHVFLEDRRLSDQLDVHSLSYILQGFAKDRVVHQLK